MAAAKVQPQGRIRIKGQFRDGLQFAYNPGSGALTDITTGRNGVLSQGTIVAGPQGRSLKFGATADQGLSFGTGRNVFNAPGDLTVLVVAAPVSQAQRSTIINQREAEDFFGVNFNTDHDLNINAGYFSVGGSRKSADGGGNGGFFVPNAVTGKISAYAMSIKASAAIAAIDGRARDAVAINVWSNTRTYVAQEFIVGDLGNFSGTGYGASEPIYLVLVWNRAFDAATLNSLTANPWQVFEGQAPMLYAASAESSPTDLLAASTLQSNGVSIGSIALTRTLVSATTVQSSVASTSPLAVTKTLVAAASNQSGTTLTGSVVVTHISVGTTSTVSNVVAVLAASQVHTLAGAASIQASNSLTGSISGDITLSPSPSSQGSNVSAGVISATKTLSGASTAQVGTTSTVSITKAVAAVGSGTGQSSVASAGVIGVVRTLVGTIAVQNSISGVGAAGGSGTLNAANDSQQNSTSTVGIAVTKSPSSGDTRQQATSLLGTVQVVHSVIAQASSQGNVSQAAAIASATIHNLSAVVTVSSASTAPAAASQVQVLSGVASAGSSSTTGVAISSVQVLGASAAVVQNTTSTGLLNSLVALVAAISTQTNSTPISAIAQIQTLVAAATNNSKVASAGVVGQVRLLFGTSGSQQGTSGVGSVVIGALITVGDVFVSVEFNPYDVQLRSDKYAVAVSNDPFDITVTRRRA